jgi:hypothetical protein
MTDLELYIKLSSLPRDLKSDVSDFIDFIKYKSLKKSSEKRKKNCRSGKGFDFDER